jgi:hypothetical protein
MSDSVKSPPRSGVCLPETQKINLFSHAVYQRIGVMAFIAYAFPAMFDMAGFSRNGLILRFRWTDCNINSR